MRRGEVWWYEPPYAKRRPVCILTRDRAIPVMQSLLAVPATTTMRGAVTEVGLDPDHGMPRECVLPLDSVWTVRKSLLTDRITVLSPATMHRVCEALRIASGC